MPYPYYTPQESYLIWDMARTRVKNAETFWDLFGMFWYGAPVESYLYFSSHFKDVGLRDWLIGALRWKLKNGKIN